jgi:DNA ligase 1
MIEFMKPMLACSLLKPTDPHTDEFIYERMKALRYPVLATLKKDGIRAIKLGDLASRTLKKIPNLSIQERAIQVLKYGIDCELWNADLTYDQVESIVMSRQHKDEGLIQFHILDWWHPTLPYSERIYSALAEHRANQFCWGEQPSLCVNAQELFEHFLRFESQEGEGICFRTPDSPYKQGRSTLREQWLIKLARYTRAEATVIGFEEQLLNTNAATIDFVGKTKRPTFKAGMVGKGVLGAFVVRTDTGVEFTIGTGVGLTDVKRAEIWDNQDKWLGQKIVYKSKAHGQKLKPRSPIYVGRRSEIDL